MKPKNARPGGAMNRTLLVLILTLFGSGSALAFSGGGISVATFRRQVPGTRNALGIFAGWCVAASALLFLPVFAAAADDHVFNNTNIGAVQSGPTQPTVFSLTEPTLISFITNYHYFNGGVLPGTIALHHHDGTIYGPWQTSGRLGQGGVVNASWDAWPGVVLKSGTYTVVDSHPATWSHNSQSGNQGFTRIKGTSIDERIPSGVSFSDLRGEVYVIPADNPDDFYFAELDSVLYVDDIVEARGDGGAILSLRNMTTFVLQENSKIRIGDQVEEQHNIRLLFGHMFTNVKRMLEDGSMDIEMSQAVAGIKGTSLILSDDGTTSKVTVVSGSVEVTPRTTDAPVLLGMGESMSVEGVQVSNEVGVDIAGELAQFGPIQQQWIQELLEEDATFTLSYTAGSGGSLSGTTIQTVEAGQSGSEVTAVPDAGAVFSSWSDGVLTSSRTDTNVQANLEVTATFRSEGGVELDWYAEHGITLEAGQTWADLDSLDLQGKGMTLHEEFLAGTDPADPQSRFAATPPAAEGTGFEIHFQPSLPERRYTLFRTTDLTETEWLVVPGMQNMPGGNGPMVDAEPPEGSAFYRIEVSLP